MKSVPAWVYYSVYRVLMFVAPLTILLLLQLEWWLATLLAAVIGLCLSYIFLRKPRESVARDLYKMKHREKEPVHPDAESEDAALDRLEREGETEHHPVGERGQAGELKGENQLP